MTPRAKQAPPGVFIPAPRDVKTVKGCTGLSSFVWWTGSCARCWET